MVGFGFKFGLIKSGGDSGPYITISSSSVLESAASGTAVGTLSVNNGTGTYTFSITADPDNKFALNVDGVTLETDATLDYETATSHSVTIEADNGVDDPISRVITVSVTNVFEAADLNALTLSASTIAENSDEDTVVGAVQNKTTSSTLSLTDTAGGRFKLSGTDIVAGATSTDYETATSHNITIRETLADSANSPRDSVVAITVTDVDEIAPVITSSSTFNVDENTAFSQTLTADESVTWTVVGGADSALFSFDGDTLEMGAQDYEAPADANADNGYVVTVRATDAASNYSEQTITVTVDDVAVEFSPDNISGLLQWLFSSDETVGTNLSGSTLVDTSANAGDARDIQQGRCYQCENDGNDIIPMTTAVALTGDFTLESWFEWDGSGGNCTIWGDASSLDGLYVNTASNTMYCRINSINTQFASVSVSSNTIYHVVCTRSESDVTISLYDETDTLVSTQTISITVATLTIGQFSGRQGTVAEWGGKLWGGKVYDENDALKVFYKADEQGGTTAYDSSGNGNHGTITNATLSTFHATQDVYSYQNEVGYSESGGVFIPRDESDTANDVLGNTLDYTGRVPYNASLINSNCGTFDGVDDYIAAAHLTGSETVTSYQGTSTPSISAGRIDFTAGTCYDLLLSDGTYYPLAEGAGTTAYDVSGGGNHGTLTNITEVTFWGDTQDDFHYNLTYGFRLSGSTYIPALDDGSAAADGNAITNPAGNFHNGAETQIDFTGGVASPAAVIGSWETAYTFDDARTNPLFVDTATASQEFNYLAYSDTLSGSDLTDLNTYLNK